MLVPESDVKRCLRKFTVADWPHKAFFPNVPAQGVVARIDKLHASDSLNRLLQEELQYVRVARICRSVYTRVEGEGAVAVRSCVRRPNACACPQRNARAQHRTRRSRRQKQFLWFRQERAEVSRDKQTGGDKKTTVHKEEQHARHCSAARQQQELNAQPPARHTRRQKRTLDEAALSFWWRTPRHRQHCPPEV